MGDTLVAVDASLTLLLGLQMALLCHGFLLIGFHGLETMAVAAFPGIIFFHPFPFMNRHFHPLGLELFFGINTADQGAKNIINRLDLANELMPQIFGYMAIATNHSDPGAAGIMGALLVFVEYIVTHLVATDAEFQGIGGVQGGTETAKKKYASAKA
jgi:hypothetical protein